MNDADFSYKLLRSARKTMSIEVTSGGKVIVRAPLRLSIDKIEDFIARKHEWIIRHIEKAKQKAIMLPELKNGEIITLCSKPYEIRLTDCRRAKMSDGILYLPQDHPKQSLKTLVTRLVLPYLAEKTDRFAREKGFKFRDVKVICARKRWGSCSGDNLIRYNIALAFLPEKACNGVVAHELCHTVVKNHSKRFYALLNKVMHDYDKATEIRKEYGAFCAYFSED